MKVKKNGGFALVEIILGIGVLALVGLVVVQMFIEAANTQNKARDLDTAVTLAQTAAETARAAGRTTRPSYYDRDWKPVEYPDPEGFTLETAYQGTERNVLLISVYKNKPYLARDGGRVLLFELTAAAYEGVSP